MQSKHLNISNIEGCYEEITARGQLITYRVSLCDEKLVLFNKTEEIYSIFIDVHANWVEYISFSDDRWIY